MKNMTYFPHATILALFMCSALHSMQQPQTETSPYATTPGINAAAQEQFFQAADECDIDTVERLLASGTVNIHGTTIKGHTALHFAASGGHHNDTSFAHAPAYSYIKLINILITHGANVNATASNNLTPFLCAAYTGNVEMMQLLKDNGADPRVIIETRNISALHIAAHKGFSDAIEFLVRDCGINMDLQNQNGDTALIGATCNPDATATVQKLLALGANVTPKDNLGMQAIHCAAAHNNVVMMQALHEHGADLNARGSHDITPLHIAAQKGNNTVIPYMLNNGAHIFAVDDSSLSTPLAHAAINGKFDTVKLLTDHGAGAEITEVDDTVITIANKQGYTGIVNHLQQFQKPRTAQTQVPIPGKMTPQTHNHLDQLIALRFLEKRRDMHRNNTAVATTLSAALSLCNLSEQASVSNISAIYNPISSIVLAVQQKHIPQQGNKPTLGTLIYINKKQQEARATKNADELNAIQTSLDEHLQDRYQAQQPETRYDNYKHQATSCFFDVKLTEGPLPLCPFSCFCESCNPQVEHYLHDAHQEISKLRDNLTKND